jgi:hypothetical protein
MGLPLALAHVLCAAAAQSSPGYHFFASSRYQEDFRAEYGNYAWELQADMLFFFFSRSP